MRRNRFISLSLIVGLLGLTGLMPGDARAQESAVRSASARGLAWLAARQKPDGRVSRSDASGPTGISDDVAVTSLAGLAFLGSGSESDKGQYGSHIRAAIDFILASQSPETGLISAARNQIPMYGHGYATLFLAECWMKHHDDRVKEALDKAVGLIQKSVNNEGGWRYQTKPRDADVSVTACELNALLAARAAGIDVDRKVIDVAIAYVRKCQNQDGGFSYMAGQGGLNGSGLPRSAAAVAVLLHSGALAGDQDVRRGMDYVIARAPDRAKTEGHYFYGCYYAGQWLHAGGDDARKAYDRLAGRLLADQENDGSWKGDFYDEYATANALVILQAPEAHLWIYRGR